MALFAIDPAKSNKDIMVIPVSFIYGAIVYIVEKSSDPKRANIAKKPKDKKKSPPRFINRANIDDLFACILVNQKFINK